MTFSMMATEAQRLISISLAKIAAYRCVRGGVSLHKNLLVATVLQKARYIFMEEAFQMVHGHFNQANSKLLQQLREQEHELRQHDKKFDEDDDTSTSSLDDSELDLFSSQSDSLHFLSDSSKESSTSTSTNLPSELFYLDLDVNRVRSQDEASNNSCTSISGLKRRLSDSDDYETEEAILSILPRSKQIKLNSNEVDDDSSSNGEALDFLSHDLTLASSSSSSNTHTATANVTMAPLDMSISTSSSSSIDRITSLVSIFNFGNLQRSTSSPDLCSSSSSSSHHASVDSSCCNLSTQRQIAMTV